MLLQQSQTTTRQTARAGGTTSALVQTCHKFLPLWGLLKLLVMYHYLRFPVICKLKRMTAKNVTNHMHAIFSEYSWPDTLVSDNGPSYSVSEIKQAIEDMGVHHITRSPHYCKSNGLNKKYLQLLNILTKGQ